MTWRNVFLISFVQFISTTINASNEPDTLFKKNTFEIGCNYTSYLDGNGVSINKDFVYFITPPYKLRSFTFPHLLYALSFSYGRFLNKKNYITITTQSNITDYPETINEGQLVGQYSRIYGIGYGHVFPFLHRFSLGKLQCSANCQIVYRSGVETYVLAYSPDPNWVEPLFGRVSNNSLGTSLGFNLRYKISKRFSVGIDCNYFYFFESNRLPSEVSLFYPTIYNRIKSNQEMATFNLKFGFSF